MKSLKTILTVALAAAGLSAMAELSVTVDSTTFDAAKRTLTVNYTLAGGEAVITFDALDGATKLDAAYLKAAHGDIYKKVAAGSGTFTWVVDDAWQGSAENLKINVKAWAKDNLPPFMSFVAGGSHAVNFYEYEGSLPYAVTNQYYKEQAVLFRKIPAAGITWVMGKQGGSGLLTPHRVTFTKDYYMGVYPLTLGQYDGLANNDKLSVLQAAGGSKASATALKYVNDTSEYGRARPIGYAASLRYYLRDTEGGTAGEWPTHGHALTDSVRLLCRLRSFVPDFTIDLPTEAEWEYAARGGVGDEYYDGSSNGLDLGWCTANNADDPNWVADMPHAVGLKNPNNFGLYDMLGNSYEILLDNYVTSITDARADETDPKGLTMAQVGKETADWKVRRGSSFLQSTISSVSAISYTYANSSGINDTCRLCCEATLK